jgi:hypothetical protein
MSITLSDKIIESAEAIIRIWMEEHKDESLLDVVQQINLASVVIHGIGSKKEEEYKRIMRPG